MGGTFQKAVLSAKGRRTEEPPIGWLMNLALSRPGLISLAAGFTDSATLPAAETRTIAERILNRPRSARAALQYGSTFGLDELREITARRIYELDRQAVAAAEEASPGSGAVLPAKEAYAPKRVLITNGSQQLLYLATEALCDPGDIALLEDPTYFVFLGIAQSFGLRCRGVATGPQGVEPEALEAALDRIERAGELDRVKLLYLVSYYQNPTGRSASWEAKRRVAEVLARFERKLGRPIYVLEDAAYREMGFAPGGAPSMLCAPGGPERTVYSGTYSKPFATGLRIGFGLLPPGLFETAGRLKNNHDFGTANFQQHILAEALRSGVYDAHLEVLRRRYARKARWMARAIAANFPPEAEWSPPSGGMYFWIRWPRRMRVGPGSRLFREALASDVLYVPGRFCYAKDETRKIPDREMRLSFGNATRREIEEGTARLAAAARKVLARGGCGKS